MSSRRWHPKSKFGCLQCKQRRVKCDESHPCCRNCSRSQATCTYLPRKHDELTQVKPHNDDASHTFTKRWHQKSRSGCLRCRKRRVKCDESTPMCMSCDRAQVACIYPAQDASRNPCYDVAHLLASNTRRLYVARVPSRTDVMAYEYFHLYILPMFRICQPSILWSYTIGFSVQTHDTLRRLAIALGCQQRALEIGHDDEETRMFLLDQSNILYGAGLRALRQTLTNMPATDAPIAALCCVLFVALECLRDSPKDLLLHLHSAVRIVVEAARNSNAKPADEVRHVADLLHPLCLSAWLFNSSLYYVGDYALVLQNVEFHQLYDLEPFDEQTGSSMEVHTAISKAVHSALQLIHPLTKPEDRVVALEQLYRLRAATGRLYENLLTCRPDTADRGFLEAKLIMLQRFLSATLSRSKDVEVENKSFSKVLDILESSLAKLKSARPEGCKLGARQPFTLVTGVISTIGAILSAKPGPLIEGRAMDLLKICPQREGLWVSERSLQSPQVLSRILHKESTVRRFVRAGNAAEGLEIAIPRMALVRERVENLGAAVE